MISVGIIGGSGFTGAELLRLCADHPQFEVRFATADTQAGTRVAELYPSLAAAYPDLVFVPYDAGLATRADLVFLGLPHGASQAMVPELLGTTKWIVDLAADFRLRDAALYPSWYGEAHAAPQLLDDFVYGLPELFREQASRRIGSRGAWLLPDDRDTRPRPTHRSGPRRKNRHRRRRRERCVGRRSPAQAVDHVLYRRRGLHRVWIARPPPHARDRAVAEPRRRRRRAGVVHAAPRAHESRHSRHLLRTADGDHEHRRPPRALPHAICRRTIRRRHRYGHPRRRRRSVRTPCI